MASTWRAPSWGYPARPLGTSLRCAPLQDSMHNIPCMCACVLEGKEEGCASVAMFGMLAGRCPCPALMPSPLRSHIPHR